VASIGRPPLRPLQSLVRGRHRLVTASLSRPQRDRPGNHAPPQHLPGPGRARSPPPLSPAAAPSPLLLFFLSTQHSAPSTYLPTVPDSRILPCLGPNGARSQSPGHRPG
jgi:hypothetical protein